MTKSDLTKKLIDPFGFGVIIWTIGFALTIVFFMVVPADMLSLFVVPILFAVTIFIAYKRLKGYGASSLYFLFVAVTWTVITIAFDYIFLVEGSNVETYYDWSTYLSYFVAFLIPLVIGLKYGRKT